MNQELCSCPGCGALTPKVDGPTHRYIGASGGCWAAYGALAEKEAGDFRYARLHQLTVAAYCAQHPGTPSPQSIRSVAVHLVGLYLQLECGLYPEKLYAGRQRIASFGKQGKLNLTRLEPPALPGEVTVLDVLDATNLIKHAELSRERAKSVWEAWADHHNTVRRWAAA